MFASCFIGIAALLVVCESEAQFGGGVAISNCGGGLAINNCVGSNCNSNNFFGRQRRLAIEKLLAGVEKGSVDEKRQLLEEILTEVEEEEFSGERKQPSWN